jgi:hypothetical protein
MLAERGALPLADTYYWVRLLQILIPENSSREIVLEII